MSNFEFSNHKIRVQIKKKSSELHSSSIKESSNLHSFSIKESSNLHSSSIKESSNLYSSSIKESSNLHSSSIKEKSLEPCNSIIDTTVKSIVSDNITHQKSDVKALIKIKKKNDISVIPIISDNTNTNQDIVLSFDVGIENLSYCVLSVDKTTIKPPRWIPKPIIYEWGLITLIPETDATKTYPCQAKLKNGTCCQVNATKFYDHPNKCITFCGTHLKGYPNILKKQGVTFNEQLISDIPKTLKCSHVKSNKSKEICNQDAYVYTKDTNGYITGYCKYHQHTNMSISMSINVQRYITANNATEYELKTVLFPKLQALNFVQRYPGIKIVIEHQPDITREMMRVLSYALYDYYLISNLSMPENGLTYIDPKNKLLMYDGTDNISCEIKDPHGRNKFLGKKYAEYLLTSYNLTDKLSYYMSFDKKDDLADSLLMGLYYLVCYQYGLVPPKNVNAIQLKIQSNYLKFKAIRACKPTGKIIANGKFTLSNIKYILKHIKNGFYAQNEIQVKSAIAFYFGTTFQINDLLTCCNT